MKTQIKLKQNPFVLILLLLGLNSFSCSSQSYLQSNSSDSISLKSLWQAKPDWKLTYDFTKLDSQSIQLDSTIEIIIFLATWCHDSERELPILLKVLNHCTFDEKKLRLIVVDRAKKNPKDLILQHQVYFTPTIIVLKNNKEIKRFIENPETNWYSDIKFIAERKTE